MKKIIQIFFSSIIILLFGTNYGICQEQAPVRIYLEHFRNDHQIQLSVRVLAKKDKRFKPAEGVQIDLYSSEITANNLLGSIITVSDGTGTYYFNQEQFEFANKLEVGTYFAVINENETFQSKKVEISIRKVDFDVVFSVEDSIYLVNVLVTEQDSVGNATTKEDVEIKLFVERPLSDLPVGEDYNTTDEEGRVSILFPQDLPGNEEGLVLVIVRIVENEDYGTVEVSQVKPWGIALKYSDSDSKRSLWASSANAPISLIIFINSLIIAVWGMICYMIYKIYQIKKLGKAS